jgi:resorcinol 4-hydroxylase (NADPH)
MPHVRGAIELSVELGKIICVPDPVEAKARDDAMAPMAANGASVPPPAPPIISEGCIAPGFALAGRTFPQGHVVVRKTSTEGRSDDVLGRRWKLIGQPGVRALVNAHESTTWFPMVGDVVEMNELVEQNDANIATWFTENNISAVLVRPDAIVFGAILDLSEIETLLDHARNSLSEP